MKTSWSSLPVGSCSIFIKLNGSIVQQCFQFSFVRLDGNNFQVFEIKRLYSMLIVLLFINTGSGVNTDLEAISNIELKSKEVVEQTEQHAERNARKGALSKYRTREIFTEFR